MLANRSAEVLQDSNAAEWYWGAVTAAFCDVVIGGCLAAARSTICHGTSLRRVCASAMSGLWTYIKTVLEPFRQGRYPLGSCGAVATSLVVVAAVGEATLRFGPKATKHAASLLKECAEQQVQWRLRRQCTLILLLLLGMAQLSSLACTNWAAAYAAAVVCVPCAVALCKYLA